MFLQNEMMVGQLTYSKWYTFDATMQLIDKRELKFEPIGFWKSKIELKDGDTVLAQFEMGWKGIVIKLDPGVEEQTYLLRTSGFMKYGFSLITTDNETILDATVKFKFKKFQFDYNFEATEALEQIENKDLLLLVTLHCINYYMKMIAVAA